MESVMESWFYEALKIYKSLLLNDLVIGMDSNPPHCFENLRRTRAAHSHRKLGFNN
jgi:hypothetical protein